MTRKNKIILGVGLLAIGGYFAWKHFSQDREDPTTSTAGAGSVGDGGGGSGLWQQDLLDALGAWVGGLGGGNPQGNFSGNTGNEVARNPHTAPRIGILIRQPKPGQGGKNQPIMGQSRKRYKPNQVARSRGVSDIISIANNSRMRGTTN